MNPALIAVTIWGSALAFALSLYGLQAMTVGARRLQQRMAQNRTRLSLDRPQIKRRPPPILRPSRNGHRQRGVLVGWPGAATWPGRVERQ